MTGYHNIHRITENKSDVYTNNFSNVQKCFFQKDLDTPLKNSFIFLLLLFLHMKTTINQLSS